MKNTNETNESPIASALVLSLDRSGASCDARSLEALKVQNVVVMSSGAWAAKYLARHPVDIIVCGDKLSDMSGPSFLKSLKSSPGMENIPAVMVSGDRTRKSVLQARDAGFSGYVLRPYDLKTFAEKLSSASLWDFGEREGLADKARKARDRREAQLEKRAWSNYVRGLRYLAGELYDKAIAAFQAAIRLRGMFAEAYEGLARAWRGKGSLKRYAVFMKKASVLHVRAGEHEKGRQTYERLIRVSPEAGNPFSTSALGLIRRGEFPRAARSYRSALALASSPREVYADMARACHFTDDPSGAARSLCRELGAFRDFPDSGTMFERLMGPPVERVPNSSSTGGFPEWLPDRIKVFLAVAGHTLSVYRRGLAAGDV